jgi:hypothetical protein
VISSPLLDVVFVLISATRKFTEFFKMFCIHCLLFSTKYHLFSSLIFFIQIIPIFLTVHQNLNTCPCRIKVIKVVHLALNSFVICMPLANLSVATCITGQKFY